MLEPFSLPLFDCSGRVRRIRSLSLADRAWFLELRVALQDRIADKDFRTVYDNDPIFKATVDECLKLHGLSPAWIDAYQAARLLFGLGDEPAILMQLNFPERKPDGDSVTLPDDIDPEAYNTASLWSATDSLAEALEIRQRYPWREVEAIMKARVYQFKQSNNEGGRSEADLEEGGEFISELYESGKLAEILNNDHRSAGTVEFEELPDDYL